MMGGGVVAGFLAYELLVPHRRSYSAAPRSSTATGYTSAASSTGGTGASGWGQSWFSGSSMFGSGWQNLQRLAARTALDLVGRAARESLPGELGTSIGQAVDQMTAKLKDEPQPQGSTT